jgi:4-amino-4-deoxy-L-arabinose transferase-like glycosyltransferase
MIDGRRGLRVVLLVLAVAFVFRLAFVVGHPPTNIKGDATAYIGLAENAVAGQRYALAPGAPTGERPPGYPAFIAAHLRAFGPDLRAVQLGQVIVGVITVAAAWTLARRFGAVAGVAAAAATALDYHLVIFTWMMLTETLFTFFLALGVLLVLRARSSARLTPWAGVGAAAGLAALVRPSGLLLGLIWGALAAPRPAEWRRALAPLAVTIATMALVVAPWAVRNAVVFGELAPLGWGSAGSGFWFGTYAPTAGYWIFDNDQRRAAMDPIIARLPPVPESVPSPLREDAIRQRESGVSLAADRAFTRAALEAVLANPIQYAWFCVLNFARTWFVPVGVFGLTDRIGNPLLRDAATLALGGTQLALAGATMLLGVARIWRTPAGIVLLATIGYFAVINSLVPGIVRYRAPLEPLLFVFSGVGVAWIVGWARGRWPTLAGTRPRTALDGGTTA